MPVDRPETAARVSRVPNQTLILCLLFLGIVISFARNTYQDQRADVLSRNIASVRQDAQKQITELREAQTASLEQDLLRLDQLTAQLQATSEDILRQSTMAADRTKAELARTVEQRHQEMIRALSDIRSDLRANINVKQGQVASSELPERPAVDVAAVSSFSDRPAPAPPEIRIVEPDPAPQATSKKGFWSKLNPFGRIKKKPVTPDTSAAQ
jgi:hypothetical protein